VTDGTANSNAELWKVTVKMPLPLKLELTGTVDGDKISGRVKAGMLGCSPFGGIRVKKVRLGNRVGKHIKAASELPRLNSPNR